MEGTGEVALANGCYWRGFGDLEVSIIKCDSCGPFLQMVILEGEFIAAKKKIRLRTMSYCLIKSS